MSDVNLVQILLTEDDLYLLHEAVSEYLPHAAEMRDALGEHGDQWQERVERALTLSSRLSGRIDDLIIAAGGDPT